MEFIGKPIVATGHGGGSDDIAKQEAMKKDAARYRWLREHGASVRYTHRNGEDGLHCELDGGGHWIRRKTLDAAIDAAMKAENE